ncbi:MAG: GYD domain-containing protein [Candidatus Lutacidiplasmatales archaeon]|nr:GYD domain-containing protein [Thermoplasmata archaeon]
MPSYVFLVTWTAEGIRGVKQSPARGEGFRKSVEQAGGKVLSFLHTMGAYDLVIAVELPSDNVANELALRAGMQGFVRTTTLKGWSSAEFAELARTL